MATDEEKRSLRRENWVPESYGTRVPERIIAQVKPRITGITQRLLTTGGLIQSLVSYLTTKAKLITPAFVTLAASVQAFLLSRYNDPDKIPSDLIRRVSGKSVEEAADIIFSKQAPAKKKAAEKKGSEKQNSNPPPKTPKKGGDASSYKGFTTKQQKRLYGSFGGDFKMFLKLKKKHKLKGNLDLMKVANFFEGGKPKFGGKSPEDIGKICQKN
jgi:hypothetical protein